MFRFPRINFRDMQRNSVQELRDFTDFYRIPVEGDKRMKSTYISAIRQWVQTPEFTRIPIITLGRIADDLGIDILGMSKPEIVEEIQEEIETKLTTPEMVNMVSMDTLYDCVVQSNINVVPKIRTTFNEVILETFDPDPHLGQKYGRFVEAFNRNMAERIAIEGIFPVLNKLIAGNKLPPDNRNQLSEGIDGIKGFGGLTMFQSVVKISKAMKVPGKTEDLFGDVFDRSSELIEFMTQKESRYRSLFTEGNTFVREAVIKTINIAPNSAFRVCLRESL